METQSKCEQSDGAILWLHRNWSDLYMTLWQAGVLAVFAAIFLILKFVDASPLSCVGAYMLIASLLVVGAIWHAAGVAAARIHLLLGSKHIKAAAKDRPQRVRSGQLPEVITGF